MVNSILVSFFNSNNIGDLLISQKLVEDIERIGYIVKPCSYEGSFKIEGKVEPHKVDLSIFDKIKNRYLNFKFWLEFEENLKQADVLILGGGNMIMDIDENSKSGQHFNKFIKIAKKLNKKVVVLSIGVGPFKNEKQRMYARSALMKCDFVTYRDKESYNLVGYNLPNNFISVDPVFLFDKLDSKVNKFANIAGVGVINTLLFNNSKEVYKNVLNGYVRLINKLSENSFEIVLFTTENADNCMMNDVYELCTKFNISKLFLKNKEDLIEFYTSGLSIIISARMHSLILGFTQNIPIVGLSWQQKINSMFEIIDQTKNCTQISEILDNIDLIFELVKSNMESNDELINNKVKRNLSILYSKNAEILENIKSSLHLIRNEF